MRGAKLGWQRAQWARGGLVVGLTLALIIAGCGGDDDDGGGDASDSLEESTTTETSSTGTDAETTTTLSQNEEVLAAYKKSIEAIGKAYDPPNSQHPDLLATHAGESLSRLQGAIRQLEGSGSAMVTSAEVHPTVKSVMGDTAKVEDCYVDHSQMVRLTSREPLGEEGETVMHVQVEMERIDGVWKMTRSEELEESCEPG